VDPRPRSRRDPDRDPFAIFEAWFAEAQARGLNDPNAMALADRLTPVRAAFGADGRR